MNAYGWAQLALFLGLLAIVTKPLGIFIHQVLTPEGRTFLTPVLGPVERVLYKLFRVDPRREQNWKQYAVAMLIFSLVSMLFTYAILRLQHMLPLNPQKFPAVEQDLAFNTAASFTTNTNWQSYSGESTMSYFSQMVGLAFHNFTSAAVGIGIAAALVRGIARHQSVSVGNFWVDLVRLNLYLLLPICVIYAVFLVSQGMIQNFAPYVQATTFEGGTQNIPMGPVASQIAIKMLGTNGGGYFNANAAYPYENPTPLSNFVQMFSIFAIPSALTYYLGREVKNQKHGWAVWSAMATLFLVGVLVAWWAEAKGNPIMARSDINVAAADGNMEGKEVRFGIFNSALFATITTDASCGAVNSMHDSFTPLGGLAPLFNIQTGEVIFGGVGTGLYGMLVFVVIAIFIAGLMVGRTPEYLGKKIEAYDVKAASLALLVLTFSILCFTAWGTFSEWGKAGLNNGGPHGFSEILYAYSSGTGNNGSAFAGLTANPANGDTHYNVTLGFAMLIGRFLMIVPILALAGSLAAKKLIPASGGSFPVSGVTFVVLLIGTILIVGALTFLPALSLGPIVEHFLMRSGRLF
jgi:K+-transporting ATPase ATPase A chain